MNPKVNLGASFEDLVNATFTRIDGVIVEKDGRGYLVMGKYCENIEDVKRLIQSAGQSLQNSINRTNE